MKFPWDLYEELPLSKRNTTQLFITNRCNMKCPECFVRHIMSKEAETDMSLSEYTLRVDQAIDRGARQINILGGEPLLHNKLDCMCEYAAIRDMKVSVYTNGTYLHEFASGYFHGATLRVSIYNNSFHSKGTGALCEHPSLPSFDVNFMVGTKTTVPELLVAAKYAEENFGCKVFFISSLRELDNNNDFFSDTPTTMPVLKYKELVHAFLYQYAGNMEIHISKRGVFESTVSVPHCKCKFANIFPGGKVIQCPYDIINEKFQEDYEFDQRPCQQNNTCLMSKIKVRRKQ